MDELALGHGLINAEPDPDGVMRRMPLVAEVGGRLTPSFALELIRVAAKAAIARKGPDIVGTKTPGGIPIEKLEIVVRDKFIDLDVQQGVVRAVSFGNFRVPVAADGTMRLHYSRPVEGRTVSATDILEQRLAKSEVFNKLAIVGFHRSGDR